MSSKTKTHATKEEAKVAGASSSKARQKGEQDAPTTLVPKLRFPEFRDAEGWMSKTLGKMGDFIKGLTYTPGDVAEKGLLVLRSGNIQNGSLVFDKDLVFVEKACDPDLLLRDGDVVICMSNGSKALVGKSAEFRQDYSGEVTIGAFCSLYRPTNPFSKITFRSEQYSDFVADSIMGGNINNLKNSTLEGFPFPIPPHPPNNKKSPSA
jgi:type I restriction enzyme, S subunit